MLETYFRDGTLERLAELLDGQAGAAACVRLL